MPSLIDIPDQILLKIARYLTRDFVGEIHGGYEVSLSGFLFRPFEEEPHPDDDLRNLALACRKLRVSAQETLYRYPKVHDGTRPPSDKHTIALAYLLRTLIERPDLAEAVRKIDLPVHCRPSLHALNGSCDSETEELRGYCCDYEAIAEVCVQLLHEHKMHIWLAGRSQAEWIEEIRRGSEAALGGLMLNLLPNLEHLTVRSYGGNILEQASNYPTKYEWVVRKLFDPAFFFDGISGYSPKVVAGFAKLKSITSNGVLPWDIITLPTLRTLEYDFQYFTNGGLFEWFGMKHLPNNSTCSNITSLILNIEIEVLYYSDASRKLREYVSELLSRFTSLATLHLRLFFEQDPPGRRLPGGFPNLAKYEYPSHLLDHANLDTVTDLVVDTADLGNFKGTTIISPMESIMFPKLQHITMPQAAFFYWPYDTLTLPSTIETIGIIDSTRCLNAWAKDILDNRLEYPGLRRISFWCDEKKAPLALGEMLIPVPDGYDPACGIDPRQVKQEWDDMRPYDYVDDDIWERMHEAGIEVVFKQESKGWRKLPQ
ncbi:hypothetical protein BU26DRAFT_276563 [Trematosphaeria pertusa]|uniref:Uncharacterized protein n=1 Tax=Trematosphaeria pertusa TaxID=390896 RepID=A0A6A6INR3_9PLEO|nr:uncharacterized protein BU26DRAFT_276563 [Trematosphaeria pertusa]KAF2251123.1 hypothetical protein BU26DRAFT_276563 [Trematosphaeria pertusa]